jgi:hypothetical protein
MSDRNLFRSNGVYDILIVIRQKIEGSSPVARICHKLRSSPWDRTPRETENVQFVTLSASSLLNLTKNGSEAEINSSALSGLKLYCRLRYFTDLKLHVPPDVHVKWHVSYGSFGIDPVKSADLLVSSLPVLGRSVRRQPRLTIRFSGRLSCLLEKARNAKFQPPSMSSNFMATVTDPIRYSHWTGCRYECCYQGHGNGAS